MGPTYDQPKHTYRESQNSVSRSIDFDTFNGRETERESMGMINQSLQERIPNSRSREREREPQGIAQLA